MNTQKRIKEFLGVSSLAIVGVSRNPKKFGNQVYKGLKEKGYNVYPVNSNLDEYEGVKCFRSVTDLPDEVEGIVLSVPSTSGMQVLEDAKTKGINQVWLQQGSSSKELVKYCEDNKFNFVDNECIFMFAEPVTSVHKLHSFFWKLIGKYPK